MPPTMVTLSAVISFAEKLEDESSSFYEKLAEKFAENKQTFLSFSEEGKKNKVLIVRTYRETITDALEACYSFEGLNVDDYDVKAAPGQTYSQSLNTAIQLEEKGREFYMDVAERSKSLLATIPMAFKKVAQTRNNRKLRLKSLLESNHT